MSVGEFTRIYLAAIAAGIDEAAVDHMIDILGDVRAKGCGLFTLGVGGGAGHAGHAVNDLREIGAMEPYAPTAERAGLVSGMLT